MTFLESLKQATDDAGFKGLSFANLQEFNAFMDSFQFEEWPRNIIVPFSRNNRITGARAKRVIPLQGWALTRITEDTNDWRSVDLEPKYIQPLRDKLDTFVVSLLDHAKIDPEVEDITYNDKTEYMFLSAHLFGVSYTINLPIVGKIC